MPSCPSCAQSTISRVNGTLSRGPVTPDGRARSAASATRHGLRGTFRAVPPERAPELGALRNALIARLGPVDAVERHWVGEIAFGLWQQQRLRALTALALAHAASGTDEPETSRLPSLATLARYRARIERDLRLAREGLEAARSDRPRLPSTPDLASPSQLRWLADRIETAMAGRAPANDTDEPEGHAQRNPRYRLGRNRRRRPHLPRFGPSRIARSNPSPPRRRVGRSTAASGAGSRRWAARRPGVPGRPEQARPGPRQRSSGRYRRPKGRAAPAPRGQGIRSCIRSARRRRAWPCCCSSPCAARPPSTTATSSASSASPSRPTGSATPSPASRARAATPTARRCPGPPARTPASPRPSPGSPSAPTTPPAASRPSARTRLDAERVAGSVALRGDEGLVITSS